MALGASSLSPIATLVQRAKPTCCIRLAVSETEAGLEEEAMPTVLGKIAVREGWHLFLACRELDMRTDSVQH